MADKSRIILSTCEILCMARKKRCHSLDCVKTYTLPIGQGSSTRHATPNALLSGLLSGQATFAILLA